MGLIEIATLIGGLSLFLLGMNQMGDGLEKACGNKMKGILEKLTSNRIVGVLAGMIITMIIQSSSATTVMTVGFVSANMMSLSQAVWVIMGANIGTTITGQLVALDIGIIAPIFAMTGVIMMVFIKKSIINEIGKIFCGFGILFIGMDMMSSSMMPLRDSEAFIGMMSKFENPFLGILVGAIFTAIIQSSSASVGILQALAISGVVKLEGAVFVLFGQNIGTCVTALLATIGTNRAAKRTSLIHFTFNIIGTVVFTIICLVTLFTELIINITPSNPAQQIANVHTIFNIVTTLLLLPFGLWLVRFAEYVLPDKDEDEKRLFIYLDNDINIGIGGSAIHLENTRLEINRMYQIACENILISFDSIISSNCSKEKTIFDQEDLVDRLNGAITKQISKCLSHESNHITSLNYSSYLIISNNIERLSDHSMNLFEHAHELIDKKIIINEHFKSELIHMRNVCQEMIDVVMNKDSFTRSVELEKQTDEMTRNYRDNMLTRLKANICTAEGALIYSSILIDFERIGDHFLNIAEAYLKISL